MKQDIFENQNFKNQFIFFSALYLLLLISFFLNENSTGGAIIDYENQKVASQAFANDFKTTLLNYENYSTRHSPVLIIFLSIFEKFKVSDDIIRLIYLHISLFLPFIFYLCLKLKFPEIDKKKFFLLIGLIFLSPTFRSLSIWPDSRLLGLSFFCISIFYLFKFINDKKYLFCILNVIFLAISSYISPNFSLFSIYFFYIFLKHYKPLSKEILIIIFVNILLALPAIYYVFVLDINFLNQPAASGISNNEVLFNNYFNQILIIPSIIFFYLILFLFIKILKIDNIYSLNKLIFSSIIAFISVLFFNYNLDYTGGGIFLHLSDFLFDNNYLFFFISFISIYSLSLLFINKFENILLVLILFLSNPQFTIYHKYYDPLILILLFTILNLNLNLKNFFKLKNLIAIYLYFLIFLLLNIIK